MSQLILTRSNNLRRGRRKVSFPRRFKVGPFTLIVSMVVFVCLISVITLVYSTKEVTKGYVLKQLDTTREVLLREFEVKTMHLAEVQSLDTIKNSEKVRSMQKPREIIYLHGETAVAIK